MIPSRVSKGGLVSGFWFLGSGFWFQGSRVSAPHGAPLDALLARQDDDTLDEHARGVDRLRVELADLDELFDLGDRDAAGRGGHRVEVARGLAVHEVPEPVRLPRRDHR